MLAARPLRSGNWTLGSASWLGELRRNEEEEKKKKKRL